ncbi:hypothetical protein [Neobacillus sp. NPDC093127]|uniref:hypothetical protein n=1 Tax=Neobacillus sp. NPDC093127 TaxID=3364296 RepID=UPI0037F9D7D3
MKKLKIIFLALIVSFSFSFMASAEDEVIKPTDAFVFKLDEPTVTPTGVKLSWTIYYNKWKIYWLTQYRIYVNGIPIYKDGELTGSVTKDNFEVIGLLPGREYEIEVVPYGSHGVWKASEKVNVKTVNKKGWVQSDGDWFYNDPTSGAYKKGWLLDSSKWYYLKDKFKPYYEKQNMGTMVSNTWEQVSKKWYYFNKSGAMVTGWMEYTDSRGKKWYYLNPNGDMKTGWLYWNRNWYYLESYGGMATGWKLVNDKWFYSYPDGRMAANTTIQGYKLNASGAWVH